MDTVLALNQKAIKKYFILKIIKIFLPHPSHKNHPKLTIKAFKLQKEKHPIFSNPHQVMPKSVDLSKIRIKWNNDFQ